MSNEIKVLIGVIVLVCIYILYRKFKKSSPKTYVYEVENLKKWENNPEVEETAESTESESEEESVEEIEEIEGIKYLGEVWPSRESGEDACAHEGIKTTTSIYFTKADIKKGAKLYSDSSLIFPVDGNNKWIKLTRESDTKHFVIKVGTTGNINIVYKCKKIKK